MHEMSHEWRLANETPQLHDQMPYASWLHGAWKSQDCQGQSFQRQYLCKFSLGQSILAASAST